MLASAAEKRKLSETRRTRTPVAANEARLPNGEAARAIDAKERSRRRKLQALRSESSLNDDERARRR